MNHRATRLALFAAVLSLTPGVWAAEVSAEAYARAERFLPDNFSYLVKNLTVTHHWLNDSDEFWYKLDTAKGKSFLIQDADTGKTRPAFDHGRIAQGLQKLADKLAEEAKAEEAAAGKAQDANAKATMSADAALEDIPEKISSDDLPFDTFKFLDDAKAIEFAWNGKTVTCKITSSRCEARPAEMPEVLVISPDGKYRLTRKEHNLYLTDLATEETRALTTDGIVHNAWATPSESNTNAVSSRLMGMPPVPLASWSPDSRFVATFKLDETEVKELGLLQYAPPDGSSRPVMHSYRYAMAGDEHVPLASLVLFDIANNRQINIQHPPMDMGLFSPIESQRSWWSANGDTFYFLYADRYHKGEHLYAVDPETGTARKLISEQAGTIVELNPNLGGPPLVRVLANGDILWYSERDGWGHLYLYDGATLQVKRQLTRGQWQVRNIVKVDEASGVMYITGSSNQAGTEPYSSYLYQLDLQGNLKMLTPEPANHGIATAGSALMPGAPGEAEAAFSPSGKYFIDQYSSPTLPTRTVLRNRDGSIRHVIAEADISALEEGGLVLPEIFEATADDGETTVFGAIFRPSNFDASQKYAVIDSSYPGPQTNRTLMGFSIMSSFGGPQALAELGFIVVTIDGRGTPFRSKAFHDYAYGNMGNSSELKDHIAALQQLVQRYPQLDLDRVGIYGYSGGGFASTRALFTQPDFYKVGFAGAGNHDQTGYVYGWGELYQGEGGADNYPDAINDLNVANLRGKLMLYTGDMDDNVHPALTIQVVDALIKANKDFDLLIVPNGNHATASTPNYVARRLWDYMVKNLMGATPPKEYEIRSLAESD